MISQKLGTAELLYNAAMHMGLQPEWLMDGRLFAVSTPLGERFLYDSKGTINSHLSSALSRNKLTTRLILERNELPNIPFLTPANRAEAESFLAAHSKIIVKPQTGSNSRDVHIVSSAEQLTDKDWPEYILEKYIAGREVRYLVLNDQVIGVHESQYGESVSQTRDLKRISYPEPDWDPDLIELALKTTDILGLRYGCVDFLISPQGQAYILEVNSSPGMKWFHAPTSGPKVDVASQFLEAMMADLHLQSAQVII